MIEVTIVLQYEDNAEQILKSRVLRSRLTIEDYMRKTIGWKLREGPSRMSSVVVIDDGHNRSADVSS